MRHFSLLLLCFCFFTATAQTTYRCPPCNAGCDSLTFRAPGNCPNCTMLLQANTTEASEMQRPLRIAFYLQDGVEVLDFAGPMEVFSYADFQVFTVSKTKDPIKSQGILTILPEYSIHDAPQADVLAFFGGNGAASAQDSAVLNWVRQQTGIEHYFSVCTGAFFLANSGLLKEQTVTTFHKSLKSLKEHAPEARVLRNVRFVDNGRIITTAGISAGIDVALHFVARIKGPVAAMQIADQMEYEYWSPGQGLVVEDAALPHSAPKPAELHAYEGTYAHPEAGEVHLVYDEKRNRLYAAQEGSLYPLYYEAPGRFRNLNNQQIIFQLSADGKPQGWQEAGKEKVYPRKTASLQPGIRALLQPGSEVN